MASRPPVDEAWVIQLREDQKNNVCPFCKKQCILFTTKTGNQYMANIDKSPHRKVYKCSNSWEEYNGT